MQMRIESVPSGNRTRFFRSHLDHSSILNHKRAQPPPLNSVNWIDHRFAGQSTAFEAQPSQLVATVLIGTSLTSVTQTAPPLGDGL